MRLRSGVTDVKDLTPRDRERMFALMRQCYENIQRESFESDLDKKWLVIQVRDPTSGDLVGFSTQVILQTVAAGVPIHALFSGDTVIEPAHWGDPALAHEWGQLVLQLIDKIQTEKFYWFLTSKGFRTYRYLPLFFRTYCPQWNEAVAREHAVVIDALGQFVGGSQYDPASRIIRATDDKDYVRKRLADPGLRAAHNSHIRFFMKQNPGYMRGDELCCLAPLSRQNFTRAAYRVINAHTVDREAV